MTFLQRLCLALLSFNYLFSIEAQASTPSETKVESQTHWTSTWYAPIDTAGQTLAPTNIRQWVRLSIGGEQIRLHFSNLHGQTPLVLSSVYIARSKGSDKHDSEQQKEVFFSGIGTAIIPPGEEVTSDAIELKTNALEELAISFYLPTGASPSSVHNTAMQNALLLPGKNISKTSNWYDGKKDDTRYFLNEVEVLGAEKARAIVAFGDSLTDGVGIENDRYHRWTDFLAQRLQQNPQTRDVAVLNAGIAGNRLMRDAKAPFIGIAGLKRFDAEVLQRPGVSAVIVSIGTNDISANGAFKESSEFVSPEELIEGYRALIKAAHAKGIKIYGATIKPRGGAKGILPHTPEAEAMRLQINQWIRESAEFDAVIDFDLILRDPEQTHRLLSRYDSGDHTHPNASGYSVMAQGIDLRLFRAH